MMLIWASEGGGRGGGIQRITKNCEVKFLNAIRLIEAYH